MLNQMNVKAKATLLGKAFEAKGVKLSRAEQLDLAAQLEGAKDWHHCSAEASTAKASGNPDWEGIRDKRMSELSPEQQKDARELWIREQIGWFPEDSQKHVRFLLERLDDVRSNPRGLDAMYPNKPFDELQLEAAKFYCEGDFSQLTNIRELADVGDALFQFVILELGDAKGDREESVRFLRQAADELLGVADQLEDGRGMKMLRSMQDEFASAANKPSRGSTMHRKMHLGFDAVDSDGRNAGMKLHLLADRFGEPYDLVKDSPDLAHVIESPDFQRLREVCVEEMGFVADNNGELGVLLESEVLTKESDPSVENVLPESETRALVMQRLKALESKYPTVKFAVGGPYSVYDHRLGAWAFVSLKNIISVDEAKQLAIDLQEAGNLSSAQ